MKVLSNLLVTLFLISYSCSTAQMTYSTSNKKAIKLFEEGKEYPNIKINEQTGFPDYQGGIDRMNQALEKDPNFWEAHMFAGEYAEILGDFPVAIKHYEEAIRINPNHSPTGGTYFYLAKLQHDIGDYEKSLKNLSIFSQNRNANPELIKQARDLAAGCTFALNSIQHPRDFNPINIGPGINTKDPEYFPTITVDGKTILFTRRIEDARVEGPIKEQEDFYVSELNDRNMWGTAKPMPIQVNTINNEGAPTIASDGRSLIFVACPDASGTNYGEDRTGKGSCDLFYTKRLGSKWTTPVNIPGALNTANWETQPSFSSDGKTLYFIRGIIGKNSTNNSDIYVSHLLDNGQWSTAQRLPDIINTPAAEESVLIHPDGKTLYFASRGHVGMGGSDLYMSNKETGQNL